MKNALCFGRQVLAIFLILSAYSLDAEACWVKRVQNADGVLRIYLIESFKGVRVYITRMGATQSESRQGAVVTDLSADFFELSLGDSAVILGGAHDQCTYTAEVRENEMGVLLEAFSRPHGMPPSTSKYFMVGAK